MTDTLPPENELKIALPSQADYETLIERLGPPESVKEQVNHYYDTPEHDLVRRHVSLRVREENGSVTVSLKRGKGWSEGYLAGEELESPAPEGVGGLGDVDLDRADPAGWDIPPIRALNEEFGSLELVHLGSVRNTRRVHRLPEGIVLEVDRTEFPGGNVDYEVEAEWGDEKEVRRVVTDLLDGWGVRWEPQTKTKHERFLGYAGLIPGCGGNA